MRKLIEKISNFFRGSLHVIGTLFGIKWKGKWMADGLFIAGWIFVVGIPVGMLFIGPWFSIFGWMIMIMLLLIITNIDDALVMMSNYLTYGVNGDNVEPYEREIQKENI